jgi:hypothetical protein
MGRCPAASAWASFDSLWSFNVGEVCHKKVVARLPEFVWTVKSSDEVGFDPDHDE